jgi:proteasome lid subunit RPN8/RPN11
MSERSEAEFEPPLRVDLRNRFLLTEAALAETERLLTTYRGADGDHEGLVFLCGREIASTTLLCMAVAPEAAHGRGRVVADQQAVGGVVIAARALGLGVLAQVHSHPGRVTYHSRGDDHMVLMPFEGMLSVVVPHYGHFGMRPLHGLGVHQFQDGRWRLTTESSIADNVTIIPGSVDLR